MWGEQDWHEGLSPAVVRLWGHLLMHAPCPLPAAPQPRTHTHHAPHRHQPSPRAGAAPSLGDAPPILCSLPLRQPPPRSWACPGPGCRREVTAGLRFPVPSPRSPTARNSSILANPGCSSGLPPPGTTLPTAARGVAGPAHSGGNPAPPFPAHLPSQCWPGMNWTPWSPPLPWHRQEQRQAQRWGQPQREQGPPSSPPPAESRQSRGGTLPCACQAPLGSERGCWRRGSRWTAWWGARAGAWDRRLFSTKADPAATALRLSALRRGSGSRCPPQRPAPASCRLPGSSCPCGKQRGPG